MLILGTNLSHYINTLWWPVLTTCAVSLITRYKLITKTLFQSLNSHSEHTPIILIHLCTPWKINIQFVHILYSKVCEKWNRQRLNSNSVFHGSWTVYIRASKQLVILWWASVPGSAYNMLPSTPSVDYGCLPRSLHRPWWQRCSQRCVSWTVDVRSPHWCDPS